MDQTSWPSRAYIADQTICSQLSTDFQRLPIGPKQARTAKLFKHLNQRVAAKVALSCLLV